MCISNVSSLGSVAYTSNEILSSSFHEYKDISIAPSKGNISRMLNPTELPFLYGNAYQEFSAT